MLNFYVQAYEDRSDRQISPLPSNIACDPKYKYRSYDGSCNNLLNPRFGQAGTIFQRLMGPANYADGKFSSYKHNNALKQN